jgi:hypothetical protein
MNPELMSTASRAHFQEWHVFNKAQSMQFDAQPQRTSDTGSVTADQKRRDAISRQRVPSPPKSADARDHGNFDTPEDYERDDVVESMSVPSWKGSVKSNTNGDVDVPTSLSEDT